MEENTECAYCGRSMWITNHAPNICLKKECQEASNKRIEEMRKEIEV